MVFQFTASYEADPQEVLKYDVDNFFQFTASYEADHNSKHHIFHEL